MRKWSKLLRVGLEGTTATPAERKISHVKQRAFSDVEDFCRNLPGPMREENITRLDSLDQFACRRVVTINQMPFTLRTSDELVVLRDIPGLRRGHEMRRNHG